MRANRRGGRRRRWRSGSRWRSRRRSSRSWTPSWGRRARSGRRSLDERPSVRSERGVGYIYRTQRRVRSLPVTGAYGRRERPEPPEPLGVPTVDAHTHLDACGCVDAADVRAALDRAAAVGVTRVVTVADDLASARWVVQAAHWDDRVVAAVALHPTRTASVTDAEFAEIERLARDPRVVAVGETGLDHYWDYSPWDAQERAFRWHIDLAKRLGKPL